jgi:hypothetical protein
MQLRELFYFDKETLETINDDSYEPEHDDSPMKKDDTRKTRLKLYQINRIRKASDLHTKEKSKELEFVRQMYSTATNVDTGGL